MTDIDQVLHARRFGFAVNLNACSRKREMGGDWGSGDISQQMCPVTKRFWQFMAAAPVPPYLLARIRGALHCQMIRNPLHAHSPLVPDHSRNGNFLASLPANSAR